MSNAPTSSSTPAPAQIPYRSGMRVRVTQQMAYGTGVQSTTIEGTVVQFGQQKTGSWFAHSKDHRLWLDRLELRKDDGELVTVNLDRFSHVEVVGQ